MLSIVLLFKSVCGRWLDRVDSHHDSNASKTLQNQISRILIHISNSYRILSGVNRNNHKYPFLERM